MLRSSRQINFSGIGLEDDFENSILGTSFGIEDDQLNPMLMLKMGWYGLCLKIDQWC